MGGAGLQKRKRRRPSTSGSSSDSESDEVTITTNANTDMIIMRADGKQWPGRRRGGALQPSTTTTISLDEAGAIAPDEEDAAGTEVAPKDTSADKLGGDSGVAANSTRPAFAENHDTAGAA